MCLYLYPHPARSGQTLKLRQSTTIAGLRTSDLEISLLIDMIIPQERGKVHPNLCQFADSFPCEAIVTMIKFTEISEGQFTARVCIGSQLFLSLPPILEINELL